MIGASMKHSMIRVYTILVFTFSVSLSADSSCHECIQNCESTSRSFLDIRPPFLSASPERAACFRNEQIHARIDGYHNAIQVVPLGSSSLDGARVARYFLPICGQSCIVDEQINVTDKNLFAPQFNVVTKEGTFRSRISLDPHQYFFGIGIEYRHEWLRKEKYNRGWWLSASTVLMTAHNKIGLRETIINDGGGANIAANPDAVDSMIRAFEQQSWNFGKISRHAQTQTGFADIELKVGYEWLSRTPYHLESYAGLLIPTSDKPNGRTLFQPLVGNGGHWGGIFGSRAGFDVADYPDYGIHIRLEISNHTQFLFPDTQTRALDLKNRPWSRYLQLYVDEQQAQQAALLSSIYLSTPGINILTRCVSVKPGIANTVNTAFVCTWKQVHAEGGYNVYVRSADSVHLKYPWQEGPAIKAVGGAGQTNPVQTIAGNPLISSISVPVSQYTSSMIKADDLNLQTATNPCTVLQTIYGSIGYAIESQHPLFLSLGGSYMFTNSSETTSALTRLMVWFKAIVAF